MNYGAQIKQTILDVQKKREQEVKEKLEKELKEFAENWLEEARSGKCSHYFREFDGKVTSADVLFDWCKENGFEARKSSDGGFTIQIALDKKPGTECENV